MAGIIIADRLEAASTSQLVIENGVALTPPTIADVNGVAIGTFCRAWVNFNGTGTVAIRASFNVSSITDNGVGDFSINFTNAMPDALFSVNGTGSQNNTYNCIVATNDKTYSNSTALARILVIQVNNAAVDAAYLNIAIFR
jgi:hypothetical protein